MGFRFYLYISLFFTALLSSTLVCASSSSTTGWKQASSGLELKKIRKVGLGMQAAGVYGVLGAQIDINFSTEYTAALGFGTGFNYSTFNIQLKRVIQGESLLPYGSIGLSRWSTSATGTDSFSRTTPGFLASKFLSQQEKNGNFDEIFIYPGVGIQYLVASGDWAGTGIFAELNLLIDTDIFNSYPIGSLGYMYYF